MTRVDKTQPPGNIKSAVELNYFAGMEAIHRLDELTTIITTMRDSYFRYGHGYDDLMDEMMGSPETVLHWIDRIMAALFAHDPEQVTDILLSELADVALADSGPGGEEA